MKTTLWMLVIHTVRKDILGHVHVHLVMVVHLYIGKCEMYMNEQIVSKSAIYREVKLSKKLTFFEGLSF